MYPARMDLRQLEIIRAIADTGSFTAAGEKLHVSQSAISRQILLLEEELGEAGVPPHRPAHPHHARRRIAAPAEPPRLPGSAGHRLGDQRHAGIAARNDAAGRRDDRLSLRLPCPARRGAAHASEPRSEDHRRQRGPLDRACCDPAAATSAWSRCRLRRPTSCRCRCCRKNCCSIDLPGASAGEEAPDRPGRPRQAAVHPLRDRIGHAPARRRVLHPRAHRARHRHGNRERGDHQGDGPPRPRDQHHSLAGGGRRRAKRRRSSAAGSRDTRCAGRRDGCIRR